MNGLNTLMLIGKLHDISKTNDAFYISIIVSDQDGDITLPITINEHLYNMFKKHSEENDLIGIKGAIGIDNNQLCIIASKVTLLSRKA